VVVMAQIKVFLQNRLGFCGEFIQLNQLIVVNIFH
jgi:hypothetical protein